MHTDSPEPQAKFRTADIAARGYAAGVHLALSATVALLAATLVFMVWYPSPFSELAGGRELFVLLITVDVVIGPLITLFVFNRRKPRAELKRDLAVVALLQFSALTYGMYSVAQARPALVALEGDRLRVVRSVELANANLGLAPEGLRTLTWTGGPRWVAAREPTREEKKETLERGLAGEDIGMRPDFWRPPSSTAAAYAHAAKPLESLLKRHSIVTPEIQRQIQAPGRPAEQLGYLPILARRSDWSALVDLRNGEVVGYVHIDGF